MIEVSVKITEDETRISERFLQYEPFWMSPDDPVIKKLINQVIASLNKDLKNPDITIKVKMTVSTPLTSEYSP